MEQSCEIMASDGKYIDICIIYRINYDPDIMIIYAHIFKAILHPIS